MGDRRPRRRRPDPDPDLADRDLLHRAAAVLRLDDACARRAGVDEGDARALAALLDLLAAAVPHLDPVVRRQALESCRLLLDEPLRPPGC